MHRYGGDAIEGQRPLAGTVGLEPTTERLTAVCSTIELRTHLKWFLENLNSVLLVVVLARPIHTLEFLSTSLQPLAHRPSADLKIKILDGVSSTHRGLLNSATSVRPLASSLIQAVASSACLRRLIFSYDADRGGKRTHLLTTLRARTFIWFRRFHPNWFNERSQLGWWRKWVPTRTFPS